MVRKNIFDYMIEINLVIRELFIFTRTEYTDRLEKYLSMVLLQFKWFAFSSFTTK